MEMSLEEAIKELEAESKIIICDKDLKLAIEIVLQALEKKDKRIYYLENKARADITHEINKHKLEIYKNYIPEKKIKDKIKELKNIRSKTCEKIFSSQKPYLTEVIADVLQELLEEKENE